MTVRGHSAHRPISWLFVPVWIFSLAAFWGPVRALAALSFEDERYSHLLLIPFVSAFLVYWDRERIFASSRRAAALGVPLFTLAAIVYWVTKPWSVWSGRNDELWLPALAIVMVWVSCFLMLYGARSAGAAIFPLCFLLLMLPVPAAFLDRAVFALQKGSAEVTAILFKVLGMPVFRDGFQFSLPGIAIEVAKECSGIRSSSALLITAILASHLFLRSMTSRLVLVLFTIPVAIFKNAVRIVTLSFLGVYVDRGWLDGPLHHQGGAVFALVGVAILLASLLWLRRLEAAPKPFHPPVQNDESASRASALS